MIHCSFFFFKHKTAYEMRISDWSSDVCSSDLFRGLEHYNERAFENSISLFMRSESYPIDPEIQALSTYWKAEAMYEVRKYGEAVVNFDRFLRYPRSEERSVVNKCVSTCRSRWSA